MDKFSEYVSGIGTEEKQQDSLDIYIEELTLNK